MTNQTKLCLTKHCHPHSGSWTKGMTGKGWKDEGGWNPKERGKSQRKLIKAAGISLIFTITVTFTSCCCRPGNGGRRSEAPGGPTSRCSIFACSGHNVITGGTGLLQRWCDSKLAQHKKHVCDTSGKDTWRTCGDTTSRLCWKQQTKKWETGCGWTSWLILSCFMWSATTSWVRWCL